MNEEQERKELEEAVVLLNELEEALAELEALMHPPERDVDGPHRGDSKSAPNAKNLPPIDSSVTERLKATRALVEIIQQKLYGSKDV